MRIRALLACSTTLILMPIARAEPLAPGFAADIVPILKARCATCHLTGQEAGNMALHPGAAYANIVNVPSIELPSMMRVAPGQPDKSYLLLKLDGTHLDAGGNGARMPFQQAPLDEATQQKFRDWIRAGAPNN